jgi:hypothetical protein
MKGGKNSHSGGAGSSNKPMSPTKPHNKKSLRTGGIKHSNERQGETSGHKSNLKGPKTMKISDRIKDFYRKNTFNMKFNSRNAQNETTRNMGPTSPTSNIGDTFKYGRATVTPTHNRGASVS